MVFEYSKALLKILVAIGKEIDFDWFIMCSNISKSKINTL